MAEINNVPAIRFKQFSAEWGLNTLGNMANLLTGKPFESKKFSKYGVFLVRGMNVKRGYLDTSKELSEFWPSSIGLEEYLLKENDILIQMDGALIGKSYAKVESKNLPALLVQRVTRVRDGEVICGFVYPYIQRDFLKHIGAIKTETAVPHLSLNDIKNFRIGVASDTEQTQIGSYFQHLDKLISLHQAKVNKLTNLKKAMLEKMFPKQDADVPEIRFKAFAGAWEEKSLGDEVADILGGGTPNTFEPAYWNGDIDWYSPTEIGTKVFADASVKKITELGLQNCSAKLLPANKTILFTSRAGIGDMAILRRTGATNQGFQSIVLKDGYDPYFIYSMGHLIKDYAIKYSSGSTFLEISGKTLGKMVIKVPSLTEQEKVGTYFQNLDKTISLHQTELDKLNNLKKACLEKMFV